MVSNEINLGTHTLTYHLLTPEEVVAYMAQVRGSDPRYSTRLGTDVYILNSDEILVKRNTTAMLFSSAKDLDDYIGFHYGYDTPAKKTTRNIVTILWILLTFPLTFLGFRRRGNWGSSDSWRQGADDSDVA